jgi:hypothetical protein
MYWLTGAKGSSLEAPQKSLKDFDLPDYDWFMEESYEGYERYLEQFKISPDDYSVDEAVNILYYMYLFIEEDEEHLDEIEDDELITYANSVLEEPVSDRESAVDGLREYFLENATGERTDFIGESGVNVAKERERYIEEDDFQTIDISKESIETSLAIREDDMPEITEFDEELRKNAIVPVRDSSGKFIKGQQSIRKPKNVYSEKYPKLNCSTCYKSGDCPQYKDGYVCAFDKMFKRFDSRNLDDVIESMQGMVNMNMGRLQKAMIFETLDGGMPTGEVTGLIDQNMRLMEKMRDLINYSPKTVVEQRRVLKADGSEEVVTSMNVNPQQGGGILSKLFGGDEDKPKKPKAKKSAKDDENIVEADYEVNE